LTDYDIQLRAWARQGEQRADELHRRYRSGSAEMERALKEILAAGGISSDKYAALSEALGSVHNLFEMSRIVR
jgi:hypothetical protein